jgi:hypothetical protein
MDTIVVAGNLLRNGIHAAAGELAGKSQKLDVDG